MQCASFSSQVLLCKDYPKVCWDLILLVDLEERQPRKGGALGNCCALARVFKRGRTSLMLWGSVKPSTVRGGRPLGYFESLNPPKCPFLYLRSALLFSVTCQKRNLVRLKIQPLCDSAAFGIRQLLCSNYISSID